MKKKVASKAVKSPQRKPTKRTATKKAPLKTKPETSIFSQSPIAPETLDFQIERARKTGKWLIAIFRIEDAAAHLDWASTNYPPTEIDLSIRLLIEQINKLKARQ